MSRVVRTKMERVMQKVMVKMWMSDLGWCGEVSRAVCVLCGISALLRRLRVSGDEPCE